MPAPWELWDWHAHKSRKYGFRRLTDELALCWIHEGRHYKSLSPLVPWHDNESELGERVAARRRDVSLHSVTPCGAGNSKMPIL